MSCWEILRDATAEQFLELKYFYHQICYKSVTNKTDIARLKDRYEKRGNTAPVFGQSLLNPSQEPDNNTVSIEFEPKPLRSQSIIYDKNSCIICQQSGGPLHKVAYAQTCESMLNVAQKMNDPGFLIRLNPVPNAVDVVASDVQCHFKCWINAQGNGSDPIQEMNNIDSVLADIEIINVVRNALFHSKEDNFIDMNQVNITYNNLLGNSIETRVNYKRYLKNLLKENISKFM